MWQKKIFFVLFIILSGSFTGAYAQTVEVAALQEFSTENPPQTISVKVIDQLELTEDIVINPGETLNGNLTDVVSPKRLKRDAGFSFKPTSYTDSQGNTYQISSDITASYTTRIDKGGLAKSAALGVGNFFVKGLSMGVAAVSGAVKNEEGNRFKSSAVSVYEASPVSLVEKGEDLNIGLYQTFYLKFPDVKKNETKDDNTIKGQNYSYEIEKE